jgi:hypothetical protein
MWRALGLTALALLPFLGSLANELVFDDRVFILHNELVRDPYRIVEIFADDYCAGVGQPERHGETRVYRPLTILSFSLNHAAGGLHAFGYHLVNLLLHAGVSLAVYFAGRLFLSSIAAFAAAALFAVHPLHTEAVVYAVGRSELLVALGLLLALRCYAAVRAGSGGSLMTVGGLCAFALALLSKEQGMVLPAILVVYEVAVYDRSAGSPGRAVSDCVRRLLPYVILLGLFAVLRTWAVGGLSAPNPSIVDNPLAVVSDGQRVLGAVAVAGRYLRLFLLPWPLSPDYSYAHIEAPTALVDPYVMFGFVAWAALGIAAVLSLRAGGRVAFSTAFAVITYLPVSNLLFPIGTVMGERLFYLPSVGLCWLAGLIMAALWRRFDAPRPRRVLFAAMALMMVVLGSVGAAYTRVWRNDLTLYDYAVRVAPDNVRMRYFLAHRLLLDAPERREEAVAHLSHAIKILPGFADLWDELAVGLMDMKLYPEAVEAAEKAVSLKPQEPRYLNNLGAAYMWQARWSEACVVLRRLLGLPPSQAKDRDGSIRRAARQNMEAACSRADGG